LAPSQGQYYELTQEFKPHTDYFEPYELERNSTPTLGQRTWTFMVYLNNLKADGTPNYDTLHHGVPVKAGYKAIITKWFRRPR